MVSTHHGLMELDIAMLLEPEVPYWLEEEEDPAVMSRRLVINNHPTYLNTSFMIHLLHPGGIMELFQNKPFVFISSHEEYH